MTVLRRDAVNGSDAVQLVVVGVGGRVRARVRATRWAWGPVRGGARAGARAMLGLG